MEPKVRFKGFEGKWIEASLSNLSSNFKYGINAPAVSFDGENKYLRITDIDDTMHSFLQNNVTSPGTDLSCCDEYLMQDGDIVIARTGASVGKSYIYHPFDGKVYFAGFLIRMRLNENTNRDFVFQNTLTNAYAKHVQFVSQRSGQPGINVNELQAYKLRIPSLSEQQNIATYFLTLDSKIQTTSKKLASLKKLKSASLVAMFPQNGESTPKVIFKGFEGEWSKVELCSISKKVTNRNMDMQYTTTLTNSAEHGIIDQLAFFDHQVSNNDNISGYYVVENGDFVYNPRISALAPVGPINQNQIGYTGVMSPLYYVFRVDGVDTDYLSYYFKTTLWHQYLKDVGNSGARFDRLAITDSDFQKMPIYLPTNREEQQAIATFFRTLDRKIALETARLEKLKQIKLACLDKMFV